MDKKNIINSKIDRRKFICQVASAGLMLGASSSTLARTVQTFSSSQNSPSSVLGVYGNAHTDDDFWSKPRSVNLKRYQNNEVINTVYWKDGRLDIEGHKKICWLFRDLSVNQWIHIDQRLLDLICAMQAWVGHYGYTKPFLLSSGYRTRAYNNSLEGAARNSMHIKGKAADLIFPDLPVSFMGDLARHYSAGGVGFYSSRGFTHVDTGRVRTWGRR